ncbi:MAG: TetR/AcrR family transcriptional regulator [Flavobacteriales bacterium]
MDNQEYELYRRTAEVYITKGIKNITMDDMAKELKVSKKTLYKYVKDRPELAAKSMQWQLEHDKKVINGILAKNLNAVEELCELSNFHMANVQKLHPSVHRDLQKYYKESWTQFVEYLTVFLHNTILGNINKGIKEGLYRNDFNAEVITKLYISKADIVFNADVFPVNKFNFGEVYMEMVKYHLSGIANEKGLREMHRLVDFKCGLATPSKELQTL